ncbi:MAG: radical SAM protein [Sandaracinaceae bacterium]|nr:radical SAM protein [Sandaracinaceae bacterium]
MSERPHLFGLCAPDLVRELAALGVACSEPEARRLLGRVISEGKDDLLPRKPVKREVRVAVEEHVDRAPLELVERVKDDFDGFVKYLFRSPDGALHEAVRIPLHKENCFTVCLSSQVGCAMRCDFCATGRLGLQRNLRAWEMVAAFRAVRDEALREAVPGRVTGVVFQGQGEPLQNYDEVIQAARVLSDPCGGRVTAGAITISTVGLVPQIRRFTAERQPFRLIVSLTSAVTERRKRLLPVAGKIPMEDLAEAIREHDRSRSGGRVTVAWVLMGGVNHDEEEVLRLKEIFHGVRLRLNLIDVNDDREGGYRRATDEERKAFYAKLQVLGVPIVRRYSGGANRNAACGMLAAVHHAAE